MWAALALEMPLYLMLPIFKITDMNVKELIEKLQKADAKMTVFCTSNTGECEYCVVNTAGVKSLYIGEDEEEDVFVIDEE